MRKSSSICIAVLMLAFFCCAAMWTRGKADAKKTKRSAPVQARESGGQTVRRASATPEASASTQRPGASAVVTKAIFQSQEQPIKTEPGLSPAQSQNQSGDPAASGNPRLQQPSAFSNTIFSLLALFAFLILFAAVVVEGYFLFNYRNKLKSLDLKYQQLDGKDSASDKPELDLQMADRLEELQDQILTLAEQLKEIEREQPEKLKQIAGQFLQPAQERPQPFDDRDIRTACAWIVQWLGEMQLNGIASERVAIQQAEPETLSKLRQHLNRLKPLEESLCALLGKWEVRPPNPAEIVQRVRGLQRKIQLFADWEKRLQPQSQHAAFNAVPDPAKKELLLKQVVNHKISITEYLRQYIKLIQEQEEKAARAVPESPIQATGDDSAAELLLADVPGYLMDWYDDFYQLYQSVLSSQTASESAREDLRLIRQQAQMAIARYEIQPEEIQLGEMSFDGRLHELAYSRYSNDFARNTVIGVQHCGFRHARTGEALRRPQVIVSSGAAGAGT